MADIPGAPAWKKGDFTETRIASEPVFDGKLLHVRRDRVRLPDGNEAVREYVLHPGAAVMIAVTDANELVFERQFRYPLARDFYELPAGKIDPGEDPLDTARRELAEETGYVASQWRHLGVIHPSFGYTNERIEIFLARGLRPVEARLDDEEFLEVFTLPLDTAIEWIRTGAITDTKTIGALFWAEKVLGGHWK
jgi:ADP-ribose pyrophosphatase